MQLLCSSHTTREKNARVEKHRKRVIPGGRWGQDAVINITIFFFFVFRHHHHHHFHLHWRRWWRTNSTILHSDLTRKGNNDDDRAVVWKMFMMTTVASGKDSALLQPTCPRTNVTRFGSAPGTVGYLLKKRGRSRRRRVIALKYRSERRIPEETLVEFQEKSRKFWRYFGMCSWTTFQDEFLNKFLEKFQKKHPREIPWVML